MHAVIKGESKKSLGQPDLFIWYTYAHVICIGAFSCDWLNTKYMSLLGLEKDDMF
jgi:hypothetical protein